MVRGGLLADEMGLGKTWETIGLLLSCPVERTLLLVPPVLQGQWSEALTKSGITHAILCSGKKEGCWTESPGARPGIRVEIATYDRASNNALMLVKKPYDRIVCDEGHLLRNGAATARFRALVQIVAPRRWILSGTPVQNSISDFYNLMTFLGMSKDVRMKTSVDVIARTTLLRRIVEDIRAAVPAMPKEKPRHFIHPVEMPHGEELDVFSALVGRYNHAIERNARPTLILELYLRIRQFIAHPQIYVAAMKKKFGEGYGRTLWGDSASKADAFNGMLSTMEKKPTIVFTNFTMEMEFAEATLVKQGYKTWKICGGLSDGARDAAISESKAAVEGGNPAVAILIQITAGGAGLNLQFCDRIFFLSSHWNPAVVDQAIARAYRMGQTSRVTIHHLLLADGAEKNLDRYMANIHQRKRKEALMVHEKLFCDSAVSTKSVMTSLNEGLSEEVECLSPEERAALGLSEDPC